MVFTMFDYAETFGGVDNYKWLRDYQAGSASMKGHVEGALARYKELNAAGVIKPEDFDMQPGNRSSMLYTDHSCAMIIENEQAELYAKQAGSDHEYGMFPFWCGNGADSDYLMSQPGYYIGVNAALGRKGKREEARHGQGDTGLYISTPEGQLAISGGELTQISNVTGTPYTKDDFNSGIQSTIARAIWCRGGPYGLRQRQRRGKGAEEKPASVSRGLRWTPTPSWPAATPPGTPPCPPAWTGAKRWAARRKISPVSRPDFS
jgi:hypothetical protein